MVMPTEETLRDVYATARTIAVVGASTDPEKDAHSIPLYLQEQGYRIVPVTPRGGELFGEPVATSLPEVPGDIDVVNVFRPAEETPGIAREAVGAGARILWLQVGIHSDEAQQIAEEGGLTFVSDTCIRATHRLLGLGPRSD